MAQGEYYGETKLPDKFAEDVLELQIKMDSEQCDLSTIQRLNELYRIAIQYYIGITPKKSLHFQKKLTSLLTNPRTLSIIDNKPTNTAKTLQKVTSQTKLHQEVAINLNEQLERFKSQPKHYVKTILENNEKKLKQTENIIREGIMRQQDSIKERVLERVRSREAQRMSLQQ